MSALARSPRAAALGLVALALTAPSASADAEIVSRIGGPGSLPFPAQLGPASADGRYVVLKLGTPNTRIPAPGPEADVTSPSGYVLRDRVDQTITPLKLETAAGAALPGVIAQISDNGKRLLLVGEGTSPVVFDRETLSTVPLPTAPGATVSARMSADGGSALLTTTGTDTANNPSQHNAIYRGPLGGTGSEVLKLHGVRVYSASADLQTVLYTRTLPKVVNPAQAAESFTGKVIGLKQGTGAPHVVAQSAFNQTRRSTETCSPDYFGIRTVKRDVYPGGLSADGGRAAWSQTSTDSDFQGRITSGYIVRKASGDRHAYGSVGSYGSPVFEAFGRTHDVTLIPLVDQRSSPTRYSRLFVNDDRTVLSSDTGTGAGPGPQPTRYVTAADYDPGESTAPSTLAFSSEEPVDSAALQPDVTWASCEGAPAPPVAPASLYVSFTKANPLRSSASMGYVFLMPTTPGYRDAKSATAEVKVFGITIWKKTLAPHTIVNLPRPWAYIPTTVKVTVQAKDGDGATPAPVSVQHAVYTTR